MDTQTPYDAFRSGTRLRFVWKSNSKTNNNKNWKKWNWKKDGWTRNNRCLPYRNADRSFCVSINRCSDNNFVTFHCPVKTVRTHNNSLTASRNGLFRSRQRSQTRTYNGIRNYCLHVWTIIRYLCAQSIRCLTKLFDFKGKSRYTPKPHDLFRLE